MDFKGVLWADEEGVQEGDRDEQEEGDEEHGPWQHSQSLGAVEVKSRSHDQVKVTGYWN